MTYQDKPKSRIFFDGEHAFSYMDQLDQRTIQYICMKFRVSPAETMPEKNDGYLDYKFKRVRTWN